MLRGIVICRDQQLSAHLKSALDKTQLITTVRVIDHYPNAVDLGRFLRATAADVVFLGMGESATALELAAQIEAQAPGTPIVAVNQASDPETLLATMRAGIREFLAPPFDVGAVRQALEKVQQMVAHRPAGIESTDAVFAFLPSKAGVGCSTLALNTAIMLSQLPDKKTLIADFDLNCGMIAFMLQINSPFSITTAIENAHDMDENLWQKMVTSVGNLDVLAAGKLAPGYRMEAAQIRHLLEFARRNYKAVCLDLSGILEKYSVEVLHEATQIFMVCTAEVPSLHLARQKLQFFRSLDLDSRVKILLNREQRRSMISISEVEKVLGMPVYMSFPNDYVGVHKALTAGKHIHASSDLGKRIRALAADIGNAPAAAEPGNPGFLEMIRTRKRPADGHDVLAS